MLKRFKTLRAPLMMLFVAIFTSCQSTNSKFLLVDIMETGRFQIGQTLRVINANNPRVVAFNIIFDHDSLDVDSILRTEIMFTENLVTGTELDSNTHRIDTWVSEKKSHPKFLSVHRGFLNISIEDDSVLIFELPMRQRLITGERVPAFSYAIAENASEVKLQYQSGTQDFTFERSDFEQKFNTIDWEDLLAGNFKKRDIDGKIVIIGQLYPQERFYLDKSREKSITGTEIQACFVNAIMVR